MGHGYDFSNRPVVQTVVRVTHTDRARGKAVQAAVVEPNSTKSAKNSIESGASFIPLGSAKQENIP
jgi:hypothetical protein